MASPGHRMSWPLLSVSGLALLGLAFLVGIVGFGVAAWAILVGAFCVLMMGSMIWMMAGMARNAIRRR